MLPDAKRFDPEILALEVIVDVADNDPVVVIPTVIILPPVILPVAEIVPVAATDVEET